LDQAVIVNIKYVQKPVVNSSFKTFEIPIFSIHTSREYYGNVLTQENALLVVGKRQGTKIY